MEFLTHLASLMGVFAFCQAVLHTIFPAELRFALLKLFNRVFNCFSSYCYFDITEIDGVNTNELYNAVQLYLSSSPSITSGTRLSLTRALNSSAVTFGLSNNDRLVDEFRGATAFWEHFVVQRQSQTLSWRLLPEEKRGFTLRVKKKHKSMILDSYLNHIMTKAEDIRRMNQDRLLYTNSRGGSIDSRGHHPWECVPFKHPSTFDTLAMDPPKKAEIMSDLRDFATAQSFYQKTGRAWKRGYLLYGPPGTGKSSMIAAMSNFLGYDVYDLELSEVSTNSELRKLLMKTTSKSIIVIEDIDCSINLGSRRKRSMGIGRFESGFGNAGGFGGNVGVGGGGGGGNSTNSTITLSGLLNFTDGLWSCCGSERIFVFTTNHIEKLDPALLRSGRMDMHIFMSYCSVAALEILLRNYLGMEMSELEDEELVSEIEGLVDKAEMTPADVSEVLIKNRRRGDKRRAVAELVEAMRGRVEKGKGGLGFKGGRNNGDVEEQEKRALEMPIGDYCESDVDVLEKFGKKDESNQVEEFNLIQ